jgi:hypothetical protein
MHKAVFPLFSTQNIVFAVTFASPALLESVHNGTTAHNFAKNTHRVRIWTN